MLVLKESEFKEDTKLFPGIRAVIDRLKWDESLKYKLDAFNIGLKSA